MRFALFLITTLAIAGDFTTSLGDAYSYMISAITADAAGNTYVVGSRALGGILSGVFVAIGDLPPVNRSGVFYGGSDVFVTKLDPNGRVLFTDTFAGKGVDQGIAIALDQSGNIYIAGATTSNDFPLSKALQTQPSPYGSGFIIKLTNDGSTILYSTYFGGVLGMTSVNAMATDAAGNLYLTGTTFASDFPHTAGMPFATIIENGDHISYPTSAVFVAALDSAGDKILFASAVGGTQASCLAGFFDCRSTVISTTGIGIALDASQNVYFGGNTNTTDLPTTPGAFLKQGIGAFAGKIAAGGTGLAYLTYLGSAEEFGAQAPLLSGSNILSAITADAASNVYLAGNTGDPKFPATPGAYQTTFGGGPIDEFGLPKSRDGFVAKLKPDGSAFVWATYLGGATDAAVTAIAIDAAGNVLTSGTTASPTFPNAQGWTQGGDFLVEFNPAGSALSYSALYPTGTVEQSVALDPSGLVHVAGMNGFVSAIAPKAAPSMKIFDFGNAFGGSVTARIAPAEVISIYGPGIGGSNPFGAVIPPVNGFYPETAAGVQVQINGMNMPLLYVSANQIHAVVPMEVITGAGATVRVINGTTVSAGYPVWIVPSAPQVFPTISNQDGTVNSGKNPAKSNSFVTLYATGWQSSFSPLADGQVATVAQDACLGNCIVSVQNVPNSAVVYGGDAPGIVAGVTQFNIKLGTTIGTGGAAVSLTGPGAAINLTIWVTP
jgi:uncharacterized protein (TIGR03437 family)